MRLGVSYDIVRGGWKFVERGTVNVIFDHMMFDYEDFRDLRGTGAAPGSRAVLHVRRQRRPSLRLVLVLTPCVVASSVTSGTAARRCRRGRCRASAASSTKPSVPASATKSPDVFVGRGVASSVAASRRRQRHRREQRQRRRRFDRGRELDELGRRGREPACLRAAPERDNASRRRASNRIAGQREDRLAARADAEPHRPAGPLRDLVEHELGTELREHGRHEVELAHRHAAAQDQHVELGVEAIDRDRERVGVVAQPRARHLSQAGVASRLASIARSFVERIWCGAIGLPTSTSSSPVEITATRGRSATSALPRPAPASTAISGGPRRMPARSTRLPAVRSLPRAMHELLGLDGASGVDVGRRAVRADAFDRHDGVGAARQRSCPS